MATGIWLDEQTVEPPSKKEVKWLSDQLTASSKRIASQLETIKEATLDLTTSKQDLVKFTEEKKNELGEIRRLLDEARKQLDELKAILEKAGSSYTEISSIGENAGKTLNEMSVQLGVITKGYEAFKADSDTLRAAINKD